MIDTVRLRHLGPPALLLSHLGAMALAFESIVAERVTLGPNGMGTRTDWFGAMARQVVGTGSVPLILAMLLLARRVRLSKTTALLFRLSAIAALGQAILGMSWIALRWDFVYRSSQAWTQLSTAFAAAFLALVALQPHEVVEAPSEEAADVGSQHRTHLST
jgi:hypothetical protein